MLNENILSSHNALNSVNETRKKVPKIGGKMSTILI